LWGTFVVIVFGGLLLRSARARWAQIRTFREEMQREAWRQQVREAQGFAPAARGSTTVIAQQGVWHHYMAPQESWSHTTLGSLIIALVVRVIVGLIVLYAEYTYFQVRWPSGRN
jgi:hypothetical protein